MTEFLKYFLFIYLLVKIWAWDGSSGQQRMGIIKTESNTLVV